MCDICCDPSLVPYQCKKCYTYVCSDCDIAGNHKCRSDKPKRIYFCIFYNTWYTMGTRTEDDISDIINYPNSTISIVDENIHIHLNPSNNNHDPFNKFAWSKNLVHSDKL